MCTYTASYTDLVHYIKKNYGSDFCTSVAGYPEGATIIKTKTHTAPHHSTPHYPTAVLLIAAVWLAADHSSASHHIGTVEHSRA
jgi:Methylenetetrahydrofolate reductase